MRHHACLASIIRLKTWRSLKPILSFFFELHSLLYFIQWIFLFSWFWPHQYLATKELILSHIYLGSLNKLIEFVGMDMCHSFDKNFLLCLRNIFLLPPHHSFGYLFLELFKCSHLWLPIWHWETQILLTF